MNYQRALEYLESLLRFGIKPGLERFAELCRRVGNPQDSLRVIHVGGTNGKGSTCAFTSAILRAAGYRVGTYLSPYVFDVRERIQINGRMISQRDFAALMTEIIPHLEAVAGTKHGQPTEFEAKTLIAFLHFVRKQVDSAVLEVGMGGRFDATNVVTPLVSVITNVSLDHTDKLGTTIAEIAFEKAGIIKPGRPLVTAVDEDAWPVISRVAEERGAPVYRLCAAEAASSPYAASYAAARLPGGGTGVTVRSLSGIRRNLRLGLRGRFQHPNAAAAVLTADVLRREGIELPEAAIRRGLCAAYAPGRLEVLRREPTVIIDGAHNPAGAAQLAGALAEEFEYRRLILVIGMLETHSAEGVVAALAPMADVVIATKSGWVLAAEAEKIAATARQYCRTVSVVGPVEQAVRTALSIATRDDLVCVTGSFYTIGEVDRRMVAAS